MNPAILEQTARAIVADGKGILAADETVPTITKRLAVYGVESTEDSRRAYRELLFTAPGISDFIGGVILQDETIRQQSSTGVPFASLLAERGIIPGIKVDKGAHALAGAPGERITDGLDGLGRRLEEYRQMGARFAKWRAVIAIRGLLPSARCVHANAEALARYAALCQERDLLPIVEPEILMTGVHTLERCEGVTEQVLQGVFDALFEARVWLEGILLKPSMVIPAQGCARQASVDEVAAATVSTLKRHVPPAVPAIAFLSGGQSPVLATEHLNAINRQEGPKPWPLSFSYGRALQDEALQVWEGRSENVPAAQGAFHHRARCDHAAALGSYRSELEQEAWTPAPSRAPSEPTSVTGETPWQTH